VHWFIHTLSQVTDSDSLSHTCTRIVTHRPTPSSHSTYTSLSSLTLSELFLPPHKALPTLALTPVAMVTGSRTGAPLCVPPAAPEGVQTPVEVRRWAPCVLPPQGPGERTERTPELLPNGITLPIQVGLLSALRCPDCSLVSYLGVHSSLFLLLLHHGWLIILMWSYGDIHPQHTHNDCVVIYVVI